MNEKHTVTIRSHSINVGKLKNEKKSRDKEEDTFHYGRRTIHSFTLSSSFFLYTYSKQYGQRGWTAVR